MRSNIARLDAKETNHGNLDIELSDIELYGFHTATVFT